MGERDGEFFWNETPLSYYESRRTFLVEMLHFVDTYCDVEPTFGPRSVTAQLRQLAAHVDAASLDAIYLCLERDAVLLSEDGGFRFLAAEVGVTRSVGLQPVLIECLSRKLIGDATYSEAVFGKLKRADSWVSVRWEDLMWAATTVPHEVSEHVHTALQSFTQKSLDIASGVQVCGRFLVGIVGRLDANVVSEYAGLCLDALVKGRNDVADHIHAALAQALSHAMERLPNKMRTTLRRRLSTFLHIDSPRSTTLKLTPIARAVQLMIGQQRGIT